MDITLWATPISSKPSVDLFNTALTVNTWMDPKVQQTSSMVTPLRFGRHRVHFKVSWLGRQLALTDYCTWTNREFSLGMYVRILPLHSQHAGVQQHTVVNEEKTLLPSLWDDAQSYLYKVCIYWRCCYLYSNMQDLDGWLPGLSHSASERAFSPLTTVRCWI